MKVLCVTFEAPSSKYGGGWGIIQSLASVSSNAEIDYCGPQFDKAEFSQFKISKYYFMNETKNIFRKIINLVQGVPVRYYHEWNRISRILDPSEYDLVYIDFSYNDFVLKWAHKNGLKAIVRVHNVEHDMVTNIVRTMVIDKYWVRALINGWLVSRREEYCMKNADKLIFLTREDLDRAKELYGNYVDSNKRSCIVPVCLESPKMEAENVDVKKPYILSTGSLYYGPNALGIKWFIKNVWNKIQQNNLLGEYDLVIAGRNPDDEMKKICADTKNCVLFDSPEKISPYFVNADIYVAPIFSGAGMKVKVAEALSYGLPVVGAHHALLGYDEACAFCVEANNEDEFIKKITYFVANKISKKDCKEEYEKLYSLDRSRQLFNEIFKAFVDK